MRAFAALCVLACGVRAQVIDETFIERAIAAAEVTVGNQTNFDLYSDFSGATLASKSGACYVAFSGDDLNNPSFLERIRSFFAFQSFEQVCSGDDCCDIRIPASRSYRDASFRSELETSLQACVDTCPSCPVVLTGIHQGAAVANAASIYLGDLNPTVITFGTPPIFREGGCNDIDSSNYYRFVNAVESQYRRFYGTPPGGLPYDFFPLSYDDTPLDGKLKADHVGYLLTMHEDTNIASIGLDSQLPLKPRFDEAGQMTVADPCQYAEKTVDCSESKYEGYLQRLYDIRDKYNTVEFTYPVELGYPDGDLCNFDEECESGECKKRCPLCPPRCIE